MCCLHPFTKQNNKVFVQTFRCAVALWKPWICTYSIRFQVIKLKLLCETLKNEKWKILAWYPNKMRRYCQRNPKDGDWRWTNFQMQVALCLTSPSSKFPGIFIFQVFVTFHLVKLAFFHSKCSTSSLAKFQTWVVLCSRFLQYHKF